MPVLKWKATEVVLTVMKQVWITTGTIDFEEELEHTSYLLEEV